jgi:hypothetical protein
MIRKPKQGWRLEGEALRMFENSNAIGHGGRVNRGDGAVNATENTLPWDRVCVLYRSVLDAALLYSLAGAPRSSRASQPGSGSTSTSGSGRGRKKETANQSGFTGQKANFNADELLFPYKVYLRMDADMELECNDRRWIQQQQSTMLGGRRIGRRGRGTGTTWTSLVSAELSDPCLLFRIPCIM